MAKKEKQESQTEQSERFQRLVQDMVDAGELSPTEADERFEGAIRRVLPNRAKRSPD